eukprot:maker-scaffold1028_size131186-snap-gene-0.41 protein:Tk10624 transcript:maker-scaffold1028_size131186-snap-gene-0.41-mRNA-1 annotation:"liquid facets"
MAVNISGLRRNIKNVAHNYTDAQVKVREATSNDPWGPSSTMMSEIADLTYNVVAFSEIMQMVWKRLNDHGKNWRHVYKSLVLLEYLIKTGSEKVAQQCKENIFAIQTLKDFQYLDDNKDQGINVREKAKALVALLKDDERLRNERVRALKAKERFAQSAAGIGNDTVYTHGRDRFDAQRRPTQGETGELDPSNPEIEAARPQTVGEEELQLQLALAMSREEAEQEESKSKSDDIRLQLALQKSREADGETKGKTRPSNDLLDLDFGNPIVENIFPSQPPPPTRTAASLDPWGMPEQAASSEDSHNDPWGSGSGEPSALPSSDMKALTFSSDNGNNDPWSPVQAQPRTSPMPPGFGNNNVSPFPSASPNMISPGNGHQSVPNSSSSKLALSLGTALDPIQLPLKTFADNDPWSTGKSGEIRDQPESIDPFSPQAQSQLEEFDMFRSEIETTTTQGVNGGHESSNLITRNPFESNPPNPFQAKVQKPPMNALMQQNYGAGSNNWKQHQQSAQQARDANFDPFM